MHTLTIEDPTQGAEAAIELVEDWLAVAALRRIVEQSSGTWPSEGDIVSRLELLSTLSEPWIFRSEAGERDDGDVIALGFDPERLMADATELGLTVARSPGLPHYDHAIVLGGTALGSINRVRRLADLLEGGLPIDHLVVSTALRELRDDLDHGQLAHRPELLTLADGAAVEFDVMVAAVRHFLGGEVQIERHDNERSDVASARATVGSVLLLAAPSDDPSRRANTSDNYRVYAEQVRDGDRVLVVTSSVYLPWQHFLAVLGFGWERPLTIEATGFPPEWMGGGFLAGPASVLREIRRAFSDALLLVRAVRRDG